LSFQAIHERPANPLSSSKPSGGTLATVLGLLDVFSLKKISAATAPYAISPIPGPKNSSGGSLITTLFGIRSVPYLGILTTSIAGGTDRPIVQRSWGLLGGNKFYGPNFSFSEHMKTRNYLTAIATHYGLIFGMMMLAIPFIRTLVKKYVYQPGDGPTKEESRNDRVEYRGIGKPDVGKVGGPRVFCRAHFEGSLYKCKSPSSRLLSKINRCSVTGILLAEAAISILRDGHQLPGGIYTPATLGQKFIDRLQSANFKFENMIFE